MAQSTNVEKTVPPVSGTMAASSALKVVLAGGAPSLAIRTQG